MWLGLPPSERTAALVNRSLAYRAAGLTSQADAELAAAKKGDRGGDVDRIIASNGGSGTANTASISGFATEVRTEDGRTTTIASAEPATAPPRNAEAAKPDSWSTTQQSEAAPSEPPSGGNRLSRWWGSVRGSSSEPESAPAPAPPPAPNAAAVTVGLDDRRPKPKAAPPRNACGDRKSHRAGALRRWRQLSLATQPDALGSRSERAVENRREAERAARRASSRASKRPTWAVSAPSIASRSDPSRTRRKALSSATR